MAPTVAVSQHVETHIQVAAQDHLRALAAEIFVRSMRDAA